MLRARSRRPRSCLRCRARRTRRARRCRRDRASRPSASRPSVSSAAIQSMTTFAPRRVAAVLQRLDDRQVRVGQVDVLADETDVHLLVGRAHALDERAPLGEVGLVLVEVQHPAHVVVETLVVEHERDLVEDLGVDRGDDALFGHVAQRRDLLLEPLRDRPVAAAHDRVGLDAAAAQLGDGVLRRLRLLLARRPDVRHERDVHVEDVLAADVVAELPDRLEERQDLDVADGAADLGDHDVDVVGGERDDALLDLVGDVRDHLHGLAEVLALAFLGEHRLVDRAGRRVRLAGRARRRRSARSDRGRGRSRPCRR